MIWVNCVLPETQDLLAVVLQQTSFVVVVQLQNMTYTQPRTFSTSARCAQLKLHDPLMQTLLQPFLAFIIYCVPFNITRASLYGFPRFEARPCSIYRLHVRWSLTLILYIRGRWRCMYICNDSLSQTWAAWEVPPTSLLIIPISSCNNMVITL